MPFSKLYSISYDAFRFESPDGTEWLPKEIEFYWKISVERKTAFAVSQAMIGLLKPHRKKVHTITSDNGKEFAGHEKVASKLKANFYFPHPLFVMGARIEREHEWINTAVLLKKTRISQRLRNSRSI